MFLPLVPEHKAYNAPASGADCLRNAIQAPFRSGGGETVRLSSSG